MTPRPSPLPRIASQRTQKFPQTDFRLMVAWEAYGKHAAFHSLPSIHGQTDGMSEFWQKIKAILSAPVEMGRNGKHENSVTQADGLVQPIH